MNTIPETVTALNQMGEDQELTLSGADYSLLTDLYQLTMAACYVGENLDGRWASFELFCRKLPEGFGYLIAMGLAQVLDYLEKLQFTPQQIDALKRTDIFIHAPERFWTILAKARFTGNVWAMPEGTAVFANEPMLRIEAPLWQAQIVETFLLNTLNYQTLIATRAARIRDIAGSGAQLLEFGTRRAFSPQASVWAARAAIAAGLDATSNVIAALKLGRQPTGTMAHALVMAIATLEGTEDDAFAAFHRYFPGAPLLIDTYDTVEAARRLAAQLQQGTINCRGVRLDSGDLVKLSQQVRSLLPNLTIFASGDIDEWEIARLKAEGAEIDGYGIGTKLVSGTPVNGVYKLVEIDGYPVMKESSGKVTYPGRKQIYREFQHNQIQSDCLVLADENQKSQTSIPLMQLVMQQGKRLTAPESLSQIAGRTAATVAALPEETRRFDRPVSLPIQLSPTLQQLIDKTRRQ